MRFKFPLMGICVYMGVLRTQGILCIIKGQNLSLAYIHCIPNFCKECYGTLNLEDVRGVGTKAWSLAEQV